MTQQFVTQAAEANLGEIAAARYAIAHGQSAHVRTFAERMLRDHTKSYDQLRQIAERAGFTVPEEASSQDHLALMHLTHSAHFNADYSENQEQDHQQAVALFRRTEENPRITPAVREYARMTLPVLVDHLHRAGQLVATEAGGNRSAG